MSLNERDWRGHIMITKYHFTHGSVNDHGMFFDLKNYQVLCFEFLP